MAPAQFSARVWVTGSPVSIDADPNVTPPATGRIIQCSPVHSAIYGIVSGFSGTTAGAPFMNVYVIGGASIVIELWFYDDTLAKWVQYKAAATVSASSIVTGFNVFGMLGARMFPRITTVNGAVTNVGYDFS